MGMSNDCNTLVSIIKIIQRRHDGSENVYRNWSDYEFGFGSPASEVWLGI